MQTKLYTLKEQSLKSKLVFFNVIVFALVLCVVLVCLCTNYFLLDQYTTASANYSLLYRYYQSAKNCNDSIVGYFYAKTESAYREYEHQNQQAHESLQQLQDIIENDEVDWKLGRLRNMQRTYSEKIDELLWIDESNNRLFAQKYDYFVRLGELIQSTSTGYFELLNDQMNTQLTDMLVSWTRQMYLVGALLLLIVITGVLFSYLSIRDITTPIGKIVQNIQLIKQGKYDLKQVKNTSKELIVLCDAFDDMAKSIQSYVANVQATAKLEKQLLEKENDNLKMNELLIQTELKVLQGQINPHFLFNTLSMISKVAYMENASKTSELMEATSSLLRYCLDKANKTSDLEGELSSIEDYLYIQRLRFGNRVEFSLQIEKDLPNVRVPGMIVQPLIENAVMHGIKDMTHDASIAVGAFLKNGFVYITVDDNGKGMSEERIQEILSVETPIVSAISNRAGIGVYNVKRRLEVFFGKNHKFFIDSNTECGTCVTVAVPVS